MCASAICLSMKYCLVMSWYAHTHLPTTEGSTDQIISFVIVCGVRFGDLILLIHTCGYSTGSWQRRRGWGMGFARACSDVG